jgi:hypothetical protein
MTDKPNQHAYQKPLTELLRSVPTNARLTIEEGDYCTHYIPVGRYCHEAADAFERDYEPVEEPDGDGPKEENERLRADILFISRWVERGIYCKNISPDAALKCIAYYPSMPWHNMVWDVDHKEYKEALYRDFPNARPPQAAKIEE